MFYLFAAASFCDRSALFLPRRRCCFAVTSLLCPVAFARGTLVLHVDSGWGPPRSWWFSPPCAFSRVCTVKRTGRTSWCSDILSSMGKGCFLFFVFCCCCLRAFMKINDWNPIRTPHHLVHMPSHTPPPTTTSSLHLSVIMTSLSSWGNFTAIDWAKLTFIMSPHWPRTSAVSTQATFRHRCGHSFRFFLILTKLISFLFLACRKILQKQSWLETIGPRMTSTSFFSD